jgi:hypothetical protein
MPRRSRRSGHREESPVHPGRDRTYRAGPPADGRIFYGPQYDKSIILREARPDSPDWLNTCSSLVAYYEPTTEGAGKIHAQRSYFETTFWRSRSCSRRSSTTSIACGTALEAVPSTTELRPVQNLKEIIGKYDDNAEFYGTSRRSTTRPADHHPAPGAVGAGRQEPAEDLDCDWLDKERGLLQRPIRPGRPPRSPVVLAQLTCSSRWPRPTPASQPASGSAADGRAQSGPRRLNPTRCSRPRPAT